MTCAELAHEMSRRYGKGLYHASALYRHIFKSGAASPADIPEFSRSGPLAARIGADLRLPSCRITAKHEDQVLKFASELSDGSIIESVVIPAHGRITLCVSSQVGCRMGCRFCATGAMGFVRDLLPEEIVWQVHAARFSLGRPIHNVVFMGMGEPLDNFENVMQAIRVMSDQRGFDIAHSHMTLSTAGHADGLHSLAALKWRKLRLAVSLNSADNELRSRLMPINRKYPLERLREELLAFPLAGDGVLFIEYVLLAGVNDSRDDADKLVRYLEGLRVRVNVIACNTGISTTHHTPDPADVQRFRGYLSDAGIFVRLRRSRGRSIFAACGQLGSSPVAQDR
jgi:23S rRNA (adenine2503-C2)-methyltransferase